MLMVRLDSTFNGTGKVLTQMPGRSAGIRDIAIQSDNKIVIGGRNHDDYHNSGDFLVGRYHSDGHLDTDFGDMGVITTHISGSDMCYSVAIQVDGKVVAAGSAENASSGNDFALVRTILMEASTRAWVVSDGL